MAKTILGIDIGREQMKLALVRGGRVVKTAAVPMPENLLREGRIVSRESMTDLLRSAMREKGMRARYGAFVMSNETVFVKNVEMPLMTIDQLKYNLPFEFNDYITGEVRDYIFDYAVLSRTGKEPDEAETAEEQGTVDTGEAAGSQATQPPWQAQSQANPSGSAAGSGSTGSNTVELMAVAAIREALEDAQEILKHAGMKLVMAAPPISAYISLLRLREASLNQPNEECGILDLGYNAVRMYMFRGERHQATRVLEIGLASVDRVVAESFGVDVHLAHTYLMSNYENCQNRQECMTAYENIAVELMRALNFYRFSNPDSSLSDLWLTGGGAEIPALAMTIGEILNIQLHEAEELIPGGDKIGDCNNYVQAIGIALA